MALLLSLITAVPLSGLRRPQSWCLWSITPLYHLGAKHTSSKGLVIMLALGSRRLFAASILEQAFSKAMFTPIDTSVSPDKAPEQTQGSILSAYLATV
jgi:hypothetical protein